MQAIVGIIIYVLNIIKKYLIKHTSVTVGNYSIGSGLDYDDIITANADIGTPLTGNLTFEHANEPTAQGNEPQVETTLCKYREECVDYISGYCIGNNGMCEITA